ncbi:flagellar protein FlaG [Roseburia sp.]|uniref:flagellar protein FlaG n=1 Tax=Roseburia sp. TaxID=2049040 RepID=UPI0035220B76
MEVQRMQDSTVTYGKTVENVDIKLDSTASEKGVQNQSKDDIATRQTDTSQDGQQSAGVGTNTQIKKAVDEINKKVQNSEAIFGIHDATNRVTIKIIDKDTKKVLKEYPPEKTLDMIAKVWEVAGLLVDQKL